MKKLNNPETYARNAVYNGLRPLTHFATFFLGGGGLHNFTVPTVECRNPKVRNPNYAEIRTIGRLNRSSSDFGRSAHLIVRITNIYPKNARKCPKSERSNDFVRISDVFEIRTILQPNDFGLYEIRTSSDFGIPLYVHTYLPWLGEKYFFQVF